jgi:hypothetical protein
LDCAYDAQEWVLSSYNFAVINLSVDCRENSVAFQQYVIRLQREKKKQLHPEPNMKC